MSVIRWRGFALGRGGRGVLVGVGVFWRDGLLFAAFYLSLGARHVVLRALRTGIFVLSKKYTAPSLTLDVVAEVVMDGWRC